MNAIGRCYWSLVVTASYISSRLRPLPARHPRLCNVCGYEGPFGPAGKGTRNDARCPRCRSVERDRLFKLWLESTPEAIAGKEVLHFAPEKSLASLIRPLAARYLTADITPGRADRVLNIEAIDAADAARVGAVREWKTTVTLKHRPPYAVDDKRRVELFANPARRPTTPRPTPPPAGPETRIVAGCAAASSTVATPPEESITSGSGSPASPGGRRTASATAPRSASAGARLFARATISSQPTTANETRSFGRLGEGVQPISLAIVLPTRVATA